LVAGAAGGNRYVDCGVNNCADAHGFAWVGKLDAGGALMANRTLYERPWKDATSATHVEELGNGNLLVMGRWQEDSATPQALDWWYQRSWVLSPDLELLRAREYYPETRGMYPLDAVRAGDDVVVATWMPGSDQAIWMRYDADGELVSISPAEGSFSGNFGGQDRRLYPLGDGRFVNVKVNEGWEI
jgi:hypothetical protein